jgi:hypothetical protein
MAENYLRAGADHVEEKENREGTKCQLGDMEESIEEEGKEDYPEAANLLDINSTSCIFVSMPIDFTKISSDVLLLGSFKLLVEIVQTMKSISRRC